MKDGYLNKCKDCTKSDSTSHRGKNLDKIREYDRNRGNRQTKEYLDNYKKRFPRKYKAHNIVSNAVRDKKLFREKCEVCGDENTHAHHDDYLKPLNVRFLCPVHHKQWHKENGEGLNP